MKLADETIVHRGITIEFHTDDDTSDPWQEWDGMIPRAKLYGRNGIDTTDSDILKPLRTMSDSFLNRNRHAIGRAVDYGWSPKEFDEWTQQEARTYECTVADQRREYFEERLAGMYESDRLEAIAALWQLQGVPAETRVSTGYSQGDYIELLFVALPQWCKDMGIDPKRHDWQREFDGARDTFGAYAWGGVIGYIVDPDGASDSCWGFYPEGSSDYFPLQEVHSECVAQARAVADSIADERDTIAARAMESERMDLYA